MKKKLPIIFIASLLSLGLILLLYPFVSDLISKWTSSAAVIGYEQEVKDMDDSARKVMLAAAEEYNSGLSGTIIKDAFSSEGEESVDQNKEYYSLLNLNGLMAYVENPSIDVYLPIYHGTGQDALKKGVGHLEGSALPIGGLGTHSVISAHRGLPGAKLFTDLDQIETGDLFYIYVLGETLVYEVDRIEVVAPEDVEPLTAVPGKDHVTLMTCTPYGINSHRMLVRGIRTQYTDEPVHGNHFYSYSNEVRALPAWMAAAAGAILYLILSAAAGGIKERKKMKSKPEHIAKKGGR